MVLLRRQQRTDAKVGRPSGARVATGSTRLVMMMMMVLLLQQERMESHLGLREQLIDLLSLFETHGGGLVNGRVVLLRRPAPECRSRS